MAIRVLCLLLILPATAFAADKDALTRPLPLQSQPAEAARIHRTKGPLYPHLPGVECYCTDREGARVEMGELRCMDLGGRQFLAQCQMSLNVPMWREVSEGCVGM